MGKNEYPAQRSGQNSRIRYEDRGSGRNEPQPPHHSSPSDAIKEKLRQRAAERSRQENAFRPSERARISRPPRRDGGSTIRPKQLAPRLTEADPRPKFRERRGRSAHQAEKGGDSKFVGHEYIDPSPEAQNLAIQEQLLQKYGDVLAGKEEMPEGDEESVEMKNYTEVMGKRKVEPDLDKVIEMPKGLHNESLGSGLNPQENVERLMAIAGKKSQGEWASVQVGEERDVNILATRIKAEGDDQALVEAKKHSDAVLSKWVSGQYEMPLRVSEQSKNNVLRGVIVNQSYTDQDRNAFLKQYEQIVNAANVQPKGNVENAVKAGAREAAMSKGKRAPHLR